MEAADYEVLSVREQLFHERVRECIVSARPGQEGRTKRGRSTGVEGEGEIRVGVRPPGLRKPSDPAWNRRERQRASVLPEGPVPDW